MNLKKEYIFFHCQIFITIVNQFMFQDTGTPSRNSSVLLIFNIDEKISEPPSFTKPSYLYDYDEDNNTIVKRAGQEIELEGSRDGLKCNILSEGTYVCRLKRIFCTMSSFSFYPIARLVWRFSLIMKNICYMCYQFL